MPLDTQQTQHQEIARLEAVTASDFAQMHRSLQTLQNQSKSAKAEIEGNYKVLETKHQERQTLENDSQADLADRASQILQLDKEIELLERQIRVSEKLQKTLQTDCEILAEDIRKLNILDSNREKAALIQFALDEFLPHQQAHLEAREKLFKVWYENDKALRLVFPRIAILGGNVIDYQSFNHRF